MGPAGPIMPLLTLLRLEVVGRGSFSPVSQYQNLSKPQGVEGDSWWQPPPVGTSPNKKDLTGSPLLALDADENVFVLQGLLTLMCACLLCTFFLKKIVCVLFLRIAFTCICSEYFYVYCHFV